MKIITMINIMFSIHEKWSKKLKKRMYIIDNKTITN